MNLFHFTGFLANPCSTLTTPISSVTPNLKQSIWGDCATSDFSLRCLILEYFHQHEIKLMRLNSAFAQETVEECKLIFYLLF